MGILARSISLAHAQTPSFAQFELIPSKESLVKNDQLTLEVFSISGETRINAIETHLTYPSDKLVVLEVNTDDSDFDIGIPEENNPGDLRISRGSSDGIRGRNHVATIVFLVQGPVQSNQIQLSNDSIIMTAETNQNILSGSNVATIPAPESDTPQSTPRKFPDSFFNWIINLNVSFWEKLITILD